MAGSALRWAALNLRCAGRPGTRQRLFRTVAERGMPGDPDSILECAAALPGPNRDDEASRELERARRSGFGILTLEDAGYPALLRVLSDPPLVLYVRGRLTPGDALAVAVVGSRRATPHGAHLAAGIAGGLGRAGLTVVSGLARGIDAAGHRGALAAGGRTIAVLGSGVDRIYPEEHRRLAGAIAERGAVISEMPIGTPPLARHFPERNRIIAGLCWATVVVEAARDSGSLITAALAAEEGRSVHAVPGPVGAPNAEGPNGLLRDGASVCRSAEDVLEDLPPRIVAAARGRAPGPGDPASGPPGGEARVALTAEQRRVVGALPATRGIGVEELGRRCGLPAGTLLATLLELELLGRVRQIPGPRFLAAPCKL